ncbi:MAG TPA: sigma-70 family RNA polymerase sigma factor [Polyangia bacterium]
MEEPNRDVNHQSLLERARAGDLVAFADLIRLYQPAVRVFIGAHVRDPAAVEDLLQDVFLRALVGLKGLRDSGAIRSWLLGIAHNRTLEHLRERLRVQIVSPDAFESLLDRSQLALLEGDDEDASAFELEALQACLRLLPPASARLVRDHYFKGTRIAQLAKQEEKNEGAVRISLFRLREKLRDCVRGRMATRGQK